MGAHELSSCLDDKRQAAVEQATGAHGDGAELSGGLYTRRAESESAQLQ